ncbi:MAG: NAD(P)H-binding protein, partial [Kofleriaceae bacterium]|nr:NAD(P)H-binding protein [Kofleriaceae bacterium]
MPTALESDNSQAPVDTDVDAKPLVALTGASGFIGGALANALRERFAVRGVGRGTTAPAGVNVDAWQRADLFNLKEAEQALAGADVAIYLVHSMMPSARLTQATFEDLDLICADNFGRAAAKAGVKQIVYLSGLLPEHGALSKHLQSRHEVEHALGLYGTPVTTIRAGLILGGGGSSFEMLVRLVERLPAMACPGWTKTRTQPVAVDDVVKLLAFAAGNAACAGQTYDIGAPDIVTYRELLELVAKQLGVKRKMVPVPFFSPSFSRLWITLVTGASRELVGPLVQSLRHEMIARDHRLTTLANITMTPVQAALASALQQRADTKHARN